MALNLMAHAKINLTLDVLSRRPDGYHNVEMIMQTIELHDTLSFTEADGVELSISGLSVPPGPENLVLKAAHLLQESCNSRKGARIHLKKEIPVAAGLAGGSTNAAATLLGLNQLWGLGLTPDKLLELAVKLGADVPFCLMGRSAIARGIGEVLTPLPQAPQFGVILVKPAFGVSTAEVYRKLDLNNLGRRPNTDGMIKALGKGDLDLVSFELANVLESVTLSLRPQLGDLKAKLKAAGCYGVLMSGSGPTIFGLTGSVGEAEEVAARLNFTECTVIVTRMI